MTDSKSNVTIGRLSAVQREQAIGILRGHLSKSTVARRMNVHPSTIGRLEERFRTTGRTRDRPRTGQPRVTTQRQDAFLRQLHLRNHFLTPSASSRQVVGRRGQVSVDTVRRRLLAAGLHARRPYVGPILTNVHRQRRGQHFTGGGRDVGGLKSSLAMNRDSGSLMPTDESACTVAMEKDTLTFASWRRTASEVAV